MGNVKKSGHFSQCSA